MKRAAAAGLLAVWLVAAFAAHAGAASVEQQYAEIKADYKTLLASERKQVYRHNWLRVIEAFKRLQKRFPKSSRADDALYMAAGAYRELHVYSYLKDDLENAVGLYDQVADKYPASNLADDALVYAGEILEKLGRREDAYARYHRCAVKFGKGDFAPKARDGQKRLAAYAPKKPPAPPPAATAENGAIPAEALGMSVVRNVEYWSNPEYTRIVIELSERAPFEHHILEKPPDGKLPRRLYIDFTGAVTAKSVPKELPVGDGLLKQIRTGQFQENVARVVLDIESIDDFQIFPIFEPFRIVVDVTGEKRADALPPVPGATPRTWTVVLDPGHGGKDPGAMSRRGDRESRLVLAIAKEAKAVLERDGRVNVVMTRATDHFISLPQRTAIANQADADLFVSIHINSARNRNAYGIETYHFAPRAREEDRELVAAENATALESVLEMDEILAALNLSYKKVESNSLATLAQTHLLTRTRALHGDVPSRKVRSAPFYVLMGAKMPAVLVECGFITSNTELGRLKNNNYQRALGEGIADAVRAYIDEYNEG